MKKYIVPPEIAFKLKEKGFEEECDASYTRYLTNKKDKQDGYGGPFGWKKGEVTYDSSYFVNNSKHDYSNKNYTQAGAPYYQQVQDWLRTNYEYQIIEKKFGFSTKDLKYDLVYVVSLKKGLTMDEAIMEALKQIK